MYINLCGKIYNFPQYSQRVEEKTIFITSLIITLIGLLFLYFYADEFTTEAVQNIDNIPKTTEVKITGTIRELTTKDKVTFLTIEGEQTITTNAILFQKEELFLHEGDYAEITGNVEDYNGKKEIIISKLIIK